MCCPSWGARAGLAIAVGNAASEVKRAAHYATAPAGGDGAVREVVELVLKGQGKWEHTIRPGALEGWSGRWESNPNSSHANVLIMLML